MRGRTYLIAGSLAVSSFGGGAFQREFRKCSAIEYCSPIAISYVIHCDDPAKGVRQSAPMFEFLFKYPRTVFAKGTFVLLGQWPLWALLLTLLVAAAGLGLCDLAAPQSGGSHHARRANGRGLGSRSRCFVCLLLFLLWQPALSISTLRPQQNIVAVVIDDSKSMSVTEDGQSRKDQVLKTLNGGLLSSLKAKFQVRLYRLGDHLERMENPDQLTCQRARHAHRRQLEGSAGGCGQPAHRRGGADERRRRQLAAASISTPSPTSSARGFRSTPSASAARSMEHDIELTDVQLPRALAGQVAAGSPSDVSSSGDSKGDKAQLAVRDSGKVLTARDIVLKGDGAAQTETVLFNAGDAGVKNLQFSIDALPQEENKNNNALTRVLYVDNVHAAHPLYGRRAALGLQIPAPRGGRRQEHRAVQHRPHHAEQDLHADAGQEAPRADLKDFAFPTKVEDLFDFQGLILGSVEANYFTPQQQDLIQQFVDRRGGGLLFLGGRSALADGGYDRPPFDDLLPVRLPESQGHVPSRSGHRGADSGRPGQLDHAHRRESRRQRGALEEASLYDELSGSGHAQAGRAGAGRNDGRRDMHPCRC